MMGKYRTLNEKNKYYIPREDYLTAIHYSLRYPRWLEEVNAAADTSMAIRYDSEKVQTSGGYDSTSEAAMRIAEINDKIKLIDNIINLVADDLAYWLRLGVCYGFNFNQLKNKGLPCERDVYYLVRKKYYYELSKKI